MTTAEILEEMQDIPEDLDEAANEVSEMCKHGFVLAETNESLQERERIHGLHAYRYEEFDDGSAVALWANDPEGKVKLKAFADMKEASVWSPRDER